IYQPNTIFITGLQLEQKPYFTSFINGSRSSKGLLKIPFYLKPPYTINVFHKSTKAMSTIVDQSTSPMIFHVGDSYYSNASISFWNYVKNLTVYIKGNASAVWTANTTFYAYNSANWDNVEHMYTLSAIDNRTFKVYVDGVYKGSITSSEDVTNIIGNVIDMGNTSPSPTAIYRDMSLYSRALADDEVAKLYNKTFGMQIDGDIYDVKIKERPSVPVDAIYFPLGANAKDESNSVSPSSEANTVYEDSAVWVGTGTSNLVPNPDAVIVTAGFNNATVGWDPALHKDAIQVQSWSNGYNGGVTAPATGYHAKWVYEGMNGF